MPIGILSWEDPAPRAHAKEDLTPIAAQLRDHPSRWAVVAEQPDTKEGRREVGRVVGAIRNGYRGFNQDGGTYTATTRTHTASDSKVIRVHARFDPHQPIAEPQSA